MDLKKFFEAITAHKVWRVGLAESELARTRTEAGREQGELKSLLYELGQKAPLLLSEAIVVAGTTTRFERPDGVGSSHIGLDVGSFNREGAVVLADRHERIPEGARIVVLILPPEEATAGEGS